MRTRVRSRFGLVAMEGRSWRMVSDQSIKPPEREDQQQGGHDVVGALDKSEWPSGAQGKEKPESEEAQDGAVARTEPDGDAAFLDGPEEAGDERDEPQNGKDQIQRSLRSNAVKNAVQEDGVDNQRNNVGDDEENMEPANAKAQRRQRGEKQGGTDQDGGLSCGLQPVVGTIREVPPDKRVEQDHPDNREQEAQEPEQGACIPEAQIQRPEGGQQERGQDERRNLIIIGHGSRESPSVPIGGNAEVLID